MGPLKLQESTLAFVLAIEKNFARTEDRTNTIFHSPKKAGHSDFVTKKAGLLLHIFRLEYVALFDWKFWI